MKNYIKILLSSAALIFAALLFCAWGEPKTVVLFNSQPITAKTVEYPETTFKTGQKIHYVILSKKGFKGNALKVQIIKKDKADKTEFWGYKPTLSRSVELENPNFYIDYIVLHEKGYYIMQVFELKNLQTPVGYGDFWVKDR